MRIEKRDRPSGRLHSRLPDGELRASSRRGGNQASAQPPSAGAPDAAGANAIASPTVPAATRSPLAPVRSTAARSTAGLRQIKLLALLGSDCLGDLSQRCSWRRFDAHERIVSRDAVDTDVYFLVSGRVRVTAFSASGRQLIYRDLAEGEWFGDLAAIDGALRSADVVAMSEVLVASISRKEFLGLIARESCVAEAQIRHLTAQVRLLTDRLFALSTLDVQHRVDAELLRLARRAGISGNVARIDPAPTHEALASQLSMNREQVTRELSRLAKRGIVERKRHALLVNDIAALQHLAGAAPANAPFAPP